MPDQPPLANPGVRFPPPLLFVAALALGCVLDAFGPWLPLARTGEVAGRLEIGGAMAIAAGATLIGWGMATFRAARTGIIPNRSASRIVDGGPYRFTRNPMYIGMSIALAGGALVVNSLWPVLLLPIVLALVVRLVIRREEAYLDQAFPEDYRRYRTRVRRWI